MSSGVTTQLRSVFAVDLHLAWAVGDEGTLLRFDGTTWRDANAGLPKTTQLRGVWAASATDAWVVGGEPKPQGTLDAAELGVIMHWDGLAWTRATGKFPALYAIHGKGGEVWAVGGSSGSPQLWRLYGSTWTPSGAALPRDVYGPALGVWVNGPDDVVVSSGDSNFTSIIRFTGSDWNTEHNVRLYGKSGVLSNIGRGPRGEPWVASTPPLREDGKGGWEPAYPDSLYDEVRAVWSPDDEVAVVAGSKGLLQRVGSDVVRPRGSMVSAKLHDSWALTTDGLYRFDATTRRWTEELSAVITDDYYEEFVEAAQSSPDNISVVIEKTVRSDGRSSQRLMNWNGKEWSQESFVYNEYGSLTRTKRNHLWFISSRRVVHRFGGAEIPLQKCANQPGNAIFASNIFEVGDDIYLDASDGGFYRVLSDGSCTYTPQAWPGENLLDLSGAGSSLFALTTVRSSDNVVHLRRFDGTAWTVVAESEESGIASKRLRVLEDGAVFMYGRSIVQLGVDSSPLWKWSGTSFVVVPTGIAAEEGSAYSLLWARSSSDFSVVGDGGIVLTKR